MKQWKYVLGFLMILLPVCVCAEDFKFVSVLSAPIASFDHVETKSPVPTEPRGVFNVGSEASAGGTINVKGNPIEVTNLYMEDNTKIVSSEDISWLVDTLDVGVNGNVQVKKLIANTVMLANNQNNDDDTNETKLNVSTKLIINMPTWTERGKAGKSLNVVSNAPDTNGTRWFMFTSNGSESGSDPATWKQIAAGSNETLSEENKADTYYPITTATAN